MYFALLFLITAVNCASNKNVLLKFKSDVDRVGKDFENLLFDIVTKVVDDISAYQVNDDYSSEEDSTLLQHSITKKILDVDLENTTEEYTTEESAISTPIVTRNVTLNEESRFKRSTDGKNDSISLNKQNGNSANTNNTHFCLKKSSSEEILELQHINELKDEIKKLHDLVILLRDQQKVISLLDKNGKNFDDDISTRFDAKDMIKILDYVNTRDINDRKDTSNPKSREKSDPIEEKMATYEKIADIKNELRQTIETLNKTRQFLAMERKKELLLEKELNDQKLDLNFLKMIVAKLYKNNMNLPRDNIKDEILGSPQHLPKELPKHSLAKSIVGKENIKMLGTNKASEQLVNEELKLENTLNTKDSELDDLEKLIRRLTNPKRTKIETRMEELQQELDKKKQEANIMKQLRFLEQKKESRSAISSRSDSEMIKKLQLALKLMDAQKSRSLDNDVESELQKLQDAIDGLKPKDDFDIPNDISPNEKPEGDMKGFETIFNRLFNQKGKEEDDDAKQFQTMLNKLLSQDVKKEDDTRRQIQVALDKMVNQGRRNSVKNNADVKEDSLLLKEVIELRKQLASMEKQNNRGGSFYSTDGGYGYGPETGTFGKIPHQTDLPTGGNFAPNYPPPMNQMFNSLDIRPQSYSNNPNIRPYSYFKSGPIWYKKSYEANFNPSTYHSSFGTKSFETSNQYGFPNGIEQNPYQTHLDGSLGPGQPNIEPPFEQNYQSPLYHPKEFGMPLPPYRHNANVNPNTLEHLIQHNTDVETYQKAVSIDSAASAYGKPLPYTQLTTNDQGYPQENRNQFFQVPEKQHEYRKPAPESSYAAQSPTGHSADQPALHPPKTSDNVDYMYQRAEDLKAQIYNLQSVIDGLNKPNYVQTPQDKETVVNLERQISELRGVMNTMIPDQPPPPYLPASPDSNQNNNLPPDPQANYASKPKIRRSTENIEKKSSEDSELYDQVVTGLRRLIFENENHTDADRTSNYEDIQKRINDLRYQLETKTNSLATNQEPRVNPDHLGTPFQYHPPNYQHSHYTDTPPKFPSMPPKFDKLDLFKSKKNDIFTSIILKIVDKIVAATPAVLEKLFGSGLTELANFGNDNTYQDDYSYSVDRHGLSDIQKLFKSLGFFGYGPLIILKIIDGFTTFVNILKKNDFFKNFLMPALILLVIAGAVVFLIWWLQPNVQNNGPNLNNPTLQPNGYYGTNNDKYDEPYSKYNYRGNGYGNNNNNYGYSASYSRLPPYTRSYSEDGYGRQKSKFL